MYTYAVCRYSFSCSLFLLGKYCATLLLEFMEDISEAIDSGKEVAVVCFDFSKAFDNVPRGRL